MQRLNIEHDYLENVYERLWDLALQVEPSVAIYNEYLGLSFMAMYGAVNSSEKT